MSVDGNRKNKIDSIGGQLSVCMGCGNAITDQYILRVAPDMEWHAACLKCANCQQFLDEKCTCFVRDGKTYCKRDYVRLFGAKCDKCQGGFTRTDMVMRARSKIFHLNCFRCSSCEKQLLPGDEFALREDCLFCRHDYDTIKDESNDEDITDDNHNTDLTCPVQLAEEPELASQETPSRPSTGGSASGGTTNGSESDRVLTTTIPGNGGTVTSRRESSGRIHKTEGKPTRVRTVLTEKQLHTLRTCYNANPRPDALMKEQLVEMTGLSPRVIRVWFQNKRCKDKKRAIFMKQAVLQQEKSSRYGSYGSMHGVPLVASPPSHQDPLGVSFDITAYQAPWKSLAEFALTHDLDRIDPSNPQYQQVLQQVEEKNLDRSMAPNYHLLSSGRIEQSNLVDENVGEKSRVFNRGPGGHDLNTTASTTNPQSPSLSPDPDRDDYDDDDYAMACEEDLSETTEMSDWLNFLPHVANNYRNIWC